MKAYGPFQQRVIDELDELNEKLDKLYDFIYYNKIFGTLPADEQVRLKLQHTYMGLYADVLKERADAFDDCDDGITEISPSIGTVPMLDDTPKVIDPEKVKDYYSMIDEVARFDVVAAAKLRNIPNLGIEFTHSKSLTHAFTWADTDEGFSYWVNINDTLGAARGRLLEQETEA